MPSSNILKRGLNFVRGFFLFLRHRKTLDLSQVLAGKRVVIVGAANSAFNTGKGEYIDGFDVVIRINKGTLLLKDNKWKQDIGRKTDILFHSFFENEKSGGGPLDFEWFDALGVQYVVNPIAAFPGYRVTFNFYKKYLLQRDTYLLPRNIYQKVCRPLGRYRPTIGYCALMSVMECDFAELYLTGFTFFRSPFGEGYRNEIRETEQVRKFIREAGLHEPDLEFESFVSGLQTASSKKIILDEALQSIVANFQHDRKG